MSNKRKFATGSLITSYCSAGVNIVETLIAEYDIYCQVNNCEPNALLLGFRERGELIRAVLNASMVPIDIASSKPTQFMGCEVVETKDAGIRFARIG
jgi:hypothetical protein